MTDREEITPAIAEALESVRMIHEDSPKARRAVAALADESRDNAVLRLKLSDQHTLHVLTMIVEDGLRERKLGWTASALRCIGNSCNQIGGGDWARGYLVQQGFRWANRCLDEDDNYDIRALATQVIYNICCGHEGAQKKCFEEEVYIGLIRFAHSLACDDAMRDQPSDKVLDVFNVAVDLVFEICGHISETKNPSPGIPPLLIELCRFESARLEAEDVMDQIASLYETLLIFLRDSDVQSGLVQRAEFAKVWYTFGSLNHRILLYTVDPPPDADMKYMEMIQQHLISVSLKYTWVLSDMSADRAFTSVYKPTGDLMIALYAQLGQDSNNLRNSDSVAATVAIERILTALCQILGNFLWGLPPQSYAHLVINRDEEPECGPLEGGIEELLFPSIDQIMAITQDEQLLHSAALLLVMIARSGTKAREKIGSERNMKFILTKLCRHEFIGLRQDAIKLLKVLGTDCPANQRRYSDLAKEAMDSLSQAQQTQRQMQQQMPQGNGGPVS